MRDEYVCKTLKLIGMFIQIRGQHELVFMGSAAIKQTLWPFGLSTVYLYIVSFSKRRFLFLSFVTRSTIQWWSTLLESPKKEDLINVFH